MSEIHAVMNEIVRSLCVRQEEKDAIHARINALAGDELPAADQDGEQERKASGRAKGVAPA